MSFALVALKNIKLKEVLDCARFAILESFLESLALNTSRLFLGIFSTIFFRI